MLLPCTCILSRCRLGVYGVARSSDRYVARRHPSAELARILTDSRYGSEGVGSPQKSKSPYWQYSARIPHVFQKDKFQITRFLRFASQITRRFSDHPASASFCLADHPTRRNVISRLPNSNTAKCRFQVTRRTKFLFPDHPVLRLALQITRRFPDHPA